MTRKGQRQSRHELPDRLKGDKTALRSLIADHLGLPAVDCDDLLNDWYPLYLTDPDAFWQRLQAAKDVLRSLPRQLSVQEVAWLYGVEPRVVRGWLRRGKVGAERSESGSYQISVVQVLDNLARRRLLGEAIRGLIEGEH